MVLKNQLNMGEEMKRLLGVALAVGLLTSCSVNYSPTDIAFDQTLSGSATGEMQTDAQGLTTANTPTQDASGSAAADGALLWERRYHVPGSYYDNVQSVAVDGSGNVVMAGRSLAAC